MPHTPNPDTHCPSCGEVLSEYGHCWQHHYPPMDPKQNAPRPERKEELPSKEALAEALNTRYGRWPRPVEADDICDIMPIENEIHFQASRNAYVDWYAVLLDAVGQPEPSSIEQLPF